MKLTFNVMRKLIASVAVTGLAGGTQAASISVPNWSFENRTSTAASWLQPLDTVDAWNSFQVIANGGTGVLQGAGTIPNVPNGVNAVRAYARLSDTNPSWPPTTGTWEPKDTGVGGVAKVLSDTAFDPDATYTLTVQVASSSVFYGYLVQLAVGGTEVDGPQTYTGYVDGGTVIAQDWDSQTISEVGSWVTSTVVYQPNASFASLAGLPLQIRLLALENEFDLTLTPSVYFDAVTLDVSAIPEPTTFGLIGVFGLAALVRRRRRD